MTEPCRWVRDKDVPGGKFLVPGCWNRVISGDDADCHCASDPETISDKLTDVILRLEAIEARLKCVEVRP